ncbi:MAG TPA: response regulator [Kofleriaceae bacterium]|nr:response regulator [Kofleriaceae bacterium]
MSIDREWRPRVLIADDDREERGRIAQWLRREGYDVYEVATADEVLGYREIDLLFLDARVAGIDFVYRLRTARVRTPALLVTAQPDAIMLDDAERLGVTVLHKPLSLERLTGAVVAAMAAPVSHRRPRPPTPRPPQ